MEAYDYFENVKSDAVDFLMDGRGQFVDEDGTFDETAAYDEAFNSDSVTGNMSGSFYCSSWRAEEALCHNSGLLREAESEIGPFERRDPETLDVCVRCYALGRVWRDALDEFYGKTGLKPR